MTSDDDKKKRKEAKREEKRRKRAREKNEVESEATKKKEKKAKKVKKEKKERRGEKKEKDGNRVGDKEATTAAPSESKGSDSAETVHVQGMDGLLPIPKGDILKGCATLGMSVGIVNFLKHKGFSSATPIQRYAWPALMTGRDLVGISETGSGKTLAFSLPGIQRLDKSKKHPSSPRILVLAPTRELAIQSFEVLSEVGKTCNYRATCIYGGVPKAPQRREAALSDMVVATPGRLQDLVDEGAFSLSHVEYLVLDEADRLLDLGFEPAVRWVVSKTNKNRQTAMLSATWPEEIQKLASEFLKDPIVLSVGRGQEGTGEVRLRANTRVTLNVEVIEERERDSRLIQLLRELLPRGGQGSESKSRIMVFALYKRDAARVETMLSRQGYKVCSVHGDKGQREREEALSLFRSNKVNLMVATDVAARGLDIPDVEAVLNYQFPLTAEDYIHRVGRTGRAGASGVTYTFFTQHDKRLAGELVQILKDANQFVPPALTKFGTHVKRKEHKMYGGFHKQPITEKSATKITFDDSDEG